MEYALALNVVTLAKTTSTISLKYYVQYLALICEIKEQDALSVILSKCLQNHALSINRVKEKSTLLKRGLQNKPLIEENLEAE
jgi:hypothetical protein